MKRFLLLLEDTFLLFLLLLFLSLFLSYFLKKKKKAFNVLCCSSFFHRVYILVWPSQEASHHLKGFWILRAQRKDTWSGQLSLFCFFSHWGELSFLWAHYSRPIRVIMGSILPGGRGFLKMEFCISVKEFPTWTASFAHLCLLPSFPTCTGSLEFCGRQGFSPQLLCSTMWKAKD